MAVGEWILQYLLELRHPEQMELARLQQVGKVFRDERLGGDLELGNVEPVGKVEKLVKVCDADVLDHGGDTLPLEVLDQPHVGQDVDVGDAARVPVVQHAKVHEVEDTLDNLAEEGLMKW